MKKIFLLAAALTLSVAGFASANEKDSIDNPENGIRGGVNATMPGDLTGAPTFDRRFLVTYDGTCAAPSSDRSVRPAMALVHATPTRPGTKT